MRGQRLRWMVGVAWVACFGAGCTEGGSTPAAPLDPKGAERGKQVYMSACLACHNVNPAADGALGPALKGSSRELLEARVMRAQYPEGYTPKRQTKVMVALPNLANDIDALAAYLK